MLRHETTEQTSVTLQRAVSRTRSSVVQCAYFVHKITKAIRSDGRETVLSLPIIRKANRLTTRWRLAIWSER